MLTLTASHLTNTQLEAEVKRLAGCEREATASLLAHLAELETRRIHLNAGFPSLFRYCTNALRLSEAAAYNRIVAARTARRFPRILGLLAEGSLNLTIVKLLAPYLTDDNCGDLLADVCHKNRREVEELLARRFPKPDTPASIRKIPAPPAGPWPLACGDESEPPGALRGPTPDPLPVAVAAPASAPASAPVALRVALPMPAAMPAALVAPGVVAPQAKHRPAVTPLATDRYQFTFTGDRETREMLDLARDMLRHAIPGGDTAAIMKRALQALLDDLARAKFAATDRPRASGQTALHSRHVPAHVKRAVWLRDRGGCAFVGGNGRRCRERGYLEFHHVVPYASGGPTTVANLQLRCRGHNGYEAELEFGERRPRGEWDVAERTTRPRTSADAPRRPPTEAARQPTLPSAQTASGP